jgi:hypothetical protein
LKRVLPFLVLGPLTGPLAAGFFYAFRAQRFGMAAVYALGILEVGVSLPTILMHELRYLLAALGR